MNKSNEIKILSVCLITAAAVFSCAKQDRPSADEPTVSILHASLARPDFEPDTRTYLGGMEAEGYPVLWEKGDTLMVVTKKYNPRMAYYKLKEGDEGKLSGEFEYAGANVSTVYVPASGVPVYAFYPKKNVNRHTSTNWEVSIPYIQKYRPGDTFGPESMPSFASAPSIDSTFQFRSMMSVLKLQLTGSEGDSVSRINVYSSTGYLCGVFEVGLDDGAVNKVLKGKHSVELVCDEPVGLSSEVTCFYIALPSVTYDDLTVLVETTDHKLIKKSIGSSSRTFTANMIKKMKPLELKHEWDVSYDYKECSYDKVGDTTNYGPGHFLGGIYWAPVNCGIGTDYEHPIGLLYQWGRKYGQAVRTESGDLLTLTASPISFEDGQKKENNEIFGKERIAYFGGQVPDNNAWWSDSSLAVDVANVWNGYDAPYNPCPDGWRLPIEEDFTNLNNCDFAIVSGPEDEDNGILFSGRLLLPFAGVRNKTTGGLSCFGEEAQMWTSSGYDDINGRATAFANTGFADYGIVTSAVTDCAVGRAVRCVHDVL